MIITEWARVVGVKIEVWLWPDGNYWQARITGNVDVYPDAKAEGKMLDSITDGSDPVDAIGNLCDKIGGKYAAFQTYIEGQDAEGERGAHHTGH